MSVSRWEASGPWPARAGIPQMLTLVNCARLQGFSRSWLYNQER